MVHQSAEKAHSRCRYLPIIAAYPLGGTAFLASRRHTPGGFLSSHAGAERCAEDEWAWMDLVGGTGFEPVTSTV